MWAHGGGAGHPDGYGGKTSHAAVVARGWGKCCVAGAETLDIDYKTKIMTDGRAANR